MAGDQPDLFGDDQPDLFDPDAAPKTYRPEPQQVRERLLAMLAEARSASRLPRERLRLYRTIFPQMSLWLPDEEAAQLRLDFDAEAARLEAA